MKKQTIFFLLALLLSQSTLPVFVFAREEKTRDVKETEETKKTTSREDTKTEDEQPPTEKKLWSLSSKQDNSWWLNPQKTPTPKIFGIDGAGLMNQSFVNLFSGAAQIMLPLQVPTGRNGLTPNLTLAYSSQLVNENSPYGFGFELELGQIKRLNKQGVSAMYEKPIYHINLGSLSGELALINEDTTSATYGLRREEQFARIKLYKTGNYWEITTKDGARYTLGASNATRTMDSTSGKVFSWHVEKIEDTSGNTIAYAYRTLDNTLYPKSIQYGGSPGAHPFEIRFEPFYSSPTPVPNRYDPRSDHSTGFRRHHAHVIDKIDIAFQGTVRLRYDFSYIERKQKWRTDLKELAIIGTNPTNGSSIPQKIAFTYYDPEEGLDTEALFLKHKLLRSVIFHQGGEITYDYTSSKQFFDTNGVLLNKNPYFSTMVVSSVKRTGPLSPESTIAYTYSDGFFFYDSPTEREVAGFGRVTVLDPAGQKTRYYFHQGGGFAGAALGEQPDSSSLIGKPYRTERFTSTGTMIQKTITTWKATLLNPTRYFVAPTSEVATLLDGKTPVSTAVGHAYDIATGNQIETTSYGNVSATDNGTFTDIDLDKKWHVVTYAKNTTKHLLAFPASEKLYDANTILIQESSFLYDGLNTGIDKGLVTSAKNHIVGENKMLTTSYAYNTLGQITKTTNPRGAITEITYDTLSLYPKTIKNHLGHATQFDYDPVFGIVKKITDPNGVISQTTVDALGRTIATHQSSAANSSVLELLSETIYNETNIPHSTEVKTYVQDNLTPTARVYIDGFGRTIQERAQAETPGTFVVRDTLYNNLGEKQKESLPYFANGITYSAPNTNTALFTAYEYDTLGRLTKASNVLGATTQTYAGRETTVLDPNGNKKTFAADALGNLIRVDEFNGAAMYTTTYAYTPLGQLAKLTDALGNIRTFTYDSLGRLKTQTDLHAPADTTFGISSFIYDENGNTTKRTKPDGQQILFTYDLLDRPLTETVSGAAGPIVTLTYDTAPKGIGKLTGIGKNDFGLLYTYDAAGRVQKEEKTISNKSFATTYAYNRQGNITEMTLPDNSSVKNTYNSSGKLEKIEKKEPGETGWQTVVQNYDYVPDGRIEKTVHGNGAVTVQTYNPADMYRLQKKITTLGNTTLQKLEYTYDPVGNIKKITDSSSSVSLVKKIGSNTVVPKKGDVTGDGLVNVNDTQCTILASLAELGKSGTPACIKSGQMLDADMNCDNSVNVTDITLATQLNLGQPFNSEIDANKNSMHDACEVGTEQVTVSAAKTALYDYDNLYRLTKATITASLTGKTEIQSFSYDAIGNMTYRSDLGAMMYGPTTLSPYANPHAVTSVKPMTGTTKNMTYDTNGNMTSDGTRTYAWDYRDTVSSITKGSTTTMFSYDHTGQRIKKNTDTYAFAFYEQEGSGKVVKRIGESTIEVEKGVVSEYTILKDHLSGSSMVLSKSGTISGVTDYYPFGTLRLNEKTGGFEEKKKFTGHELDEETKVYYYGARYYDPQTGRFISQDPAHLLIGDPQTFKSRFNRSLEFHFSNPQSLNSYSYALNNPVRNTDENGEIVPLLIYGGYAAVTWIAASGLAIGAPLVGSEIYSYAKGNRKTGQAFAEAAMSTFAAIELGVGMIMSTPLMALESGAVAVGPRIANSQTNSGRAEVGVNYKGNEVPVYRGGNSLKARPDLDIEISKDGFVSPGGNQGVSLHVDPTNRNIIQKGGAYRVKYLPKGLKFSEPNTDGHVGIQPAQTMTFEEYQNLLNQVETIKL